MSIDKIPSNKLPGKTTYSGRRRDTKRKSGFKSHADATGGKFSYESTNRYSLKKGECLEITFSFPSLLDDQYFGFGVYFLVNGTHSTSHNFSVKGATSFNEHTYPNWSKFGSIWKSDIVPKTVTLKIQADSSCDVWLYEPVCGKVWHEFFEDQRDAVLKNLAIFAPEALFITVAGKINIKSPKKSIVDDKNVITVKECNRCARFLPVNFDNERSTLAFSNHCIARSPCKHTGFGLLTNTLDGSTTQLDYGFQLECRFCKKFVVNAALNPMRTSDQMKEDGQRRRHFELLLSELNEMSPQMHFRHATGKELTNEIWTKFNKKCFKCKDPISTAREMNLDHTRPLALLWQVDETATCLCKSCNSQKRDRSPVDFYSPTELRSLSKITGISYNELTNPTPNLTALKNILNNLDWLYESFLMRKDLLKDRDGKITAELVCKALDRVVSFTSLSKKFSFLNEYHRRNTASS